MKFKKYPSIEQFRHLIAKIPKFNHLPNILNFSGTVKLHGTHADICFKDNDLQIQSRNRTLSETKDNLGCYKFLKKRENEILELLNLVLENNHGSFIMFSGEFCGKGIQSGVGISKLDPFFVIFDIYIDEKWQSMQNFKDIFNNDKRIFNIMQFETYNFSLNTDLIGDFEYLGESSLNLHILAEKIGSECPIAKYFNVIGEGEGIVWKCIEFPGFTDLWFKSKCLKHSVCLEKTIKKKNDENGKELEFVTEARLLQGIDYLNEFNLPIDKTSLGVFIKYIVDDIFKEEGNLDKSITSKINNKCREWFLENFCVSKSTPQPLRGVRSNFLEKSLQK
jgi:hypothetical protein